MTPPQMIPSGVDNAKQANNSSVCLRVNVLRVIVSARAKPAVPLCRMTATKISAAEARSLAPNAAPRKKDGAAIKVVMRIGIIPGTRAPSLVGSTFAKAWPIRCSTASNTKKATSAINDAMGNSKFGNACRNTVEADGSSIIKERARNTPEENASPLGNPLSPRDRWGLVRGRYPPASAHSRIVTR